MADQAQFDYIYAKMPAAQESAIRGTLGKSFPWPEPASSPQQAALQLTDSDGNPVTEKNWDSMLLNGEFERESFSCMPTKRDLDPSAYLDERPSFVAKPKKTRAAQRRKVTKPKVKAAAPQKAKANAVTKVKKPQWVYEPPKPVVDYSYDGLNSNINYDRKESASSATAGVTDGRQERANRRAALQKADENADSTGDKS